MFHHARRLRTVRQDTRWHNAHLDLFNRVWSTPGLTGQELPGASATETAAFQAGQTAALSVDAAGGSGPRRRPVRLSPIEAARITALLIEFTRAYPRARTYPTQLLEVAWPVLSEAQRQGLIRGASDADQLRLVVTRAADAVCAVLGEPAASWWNTDSGEWLWSSTTRSLTTGRA